MNQKVGKQDSSEPLNTTVLRLTEHLPPLHTKLFLGKVALLSSFLFQNCLEPLLWAGVVESEDGDYNGKGCLTSLDEKNSRINGLVRVVLGTWIWFKCSFLRLLPVSILKSQGYFYFTLQHPLEGLWMTHLIGLSFSPMNSRTRLRELSRNWRRWFRQRIYRSDSFF